MDGSLDVGFDGDGKVTTDFSLESEDLAYAVSVQRDGRILAAGSWLWDAGDAPCCFLRDFFLARYNTDGSLDSSFGGGDGKVSTDINREDHIYGMALQGRRQDRGCGMH